MQGQLGDDEFMEVIRSLKKGSDATDVTDATGWDVNEPVISLLELEDEARPGRVELKHFYGSSLQGHWQFSESVRYLRSLGTLDESCPGSPSVITSNYVLGPSNCLGSSKFYVQCCLDPCDGLVSKLEMSLVAAEAVPSSMEAAMMAALPQPSSLSNGLLRRRLREIASANGGRVPLHGRLFAQLLHHAYPRECPAPPAPGALVLPETPVAFKKRTEERYSEPESEMLRYTMAPAADVEQCKLPWTPGEVPLVPQSEQTSQFSHFSLAGLWAKPAALSTAAAASTLALALTLALRSARGTVESPLLATEASA